jgi:predicted ATP-grasp superfamily ATP-dependent carboligase
MDFGHATTYAVTVDIPELEILARRFLRAMGYYGLSEIEFMQDDRDGRYKLIEMNPRTWGWHTLGLWTLSGPAVPCSFDMLGNKSNQPDSPQM